MDKNRKILLIILAITLAIVIIAISIPPTKGKHGNKLMMKCLQETSVASIEPNIQSYVVLENSTSLKGYVEREGKVLYSNDNTFESTVGDLISKLENSNFNPQWSCGSKKGTNVNDLFNRGINGAIFSKGNTKIHEYIGKVGALANDSTISIFVSDMVYSLARTEMKNNPMAIKNELPKLQTLTKDTLRKLAKNDIHLLLVQYTADFNGKYYYNCTNNITKCDFKQEVMQKRPYYFLIFGTKNNLDALLSKNIITKHEKIWVTFELNKSSDFKEQGVKTASPDYRWEYFDTEGTDEVPFTFWTQGEWGELQSTVNLAFEPLSSRAFLSDWTPVSSSVALLQQPKKISNGEIEVALKEFNLLKDEEDVTIYLTCERDDYKACTIDDDILSKDKLEKLEGKTWAFDKLMEAISEVYPAITKKDTIGTIEFKLMKY